MDESEKTRASMFSRLRAGDEASWKKFSEKYRPMLKRWARSRGIRKPYDGDLADQVIYIMFRKMPSYYYDSAKGNFRGYLWTIISNEAKSLQKELATAANVEVGLWDVIADPSTNESLLDVLVQKRDSLQPQIAINNARSKGSEAQWEAWQLTEIQGLSGKEAAEQLGTTANNIDVMKYRFKKLIEEELRKLIDE